MNSKKPTQTSTVSSAPLVYLSSPLDLVRPGMQAFRRNARVYIVALLTIIGVPVGIVLGAGVLGVFLVALLTHGSHLGSSVTLLATFVSAIITIVVFAFIFAPVPALIMLESARGQKISLRMALYRSGHYRWRLAKLGILTLLASTAGYALFIIPGFVITARFSLAPFVLLDQNTSAPEAIIRSWRLTKGHLWEMWGFQALVVIPLVIELLRVVGPVIYLVYVLVMAPIAAIRYLQLREVQQGKLNWPRTHWLNYVVITGAIICNMLYSGQFIAQVQRVLFHH